MFLAITVRGRASSTLRSWAPRRPSASSEISMPGAIAPPTYWPCAADHVEGGRGAAEVDHDRRTAVLGGRGERVDDPVGADLARVVHQHRDAGAHAGLDHDRAARRRSAARSISRHSCSTAGHRRADRDAVDLVERVAEQAAQQHRPLVGRCGGRRSRPASRALTSPSSSSPSTVWLLPMSAARSGIGVTLGEVQAEVEDLDRVGQRADRDEVDAGLGDLAGAVEGEPAGGLQRGPAGGDRGPPRPSSSVGMLSSRISVAAGVEQLAELVEVGRPRPRRGRSG